MLLDCFYNVCYYLYKNSKVVRNFKQEINTSVLVWVLQRNRTNRRCKYLQRLTYYTELTKWLWRLRSPSSAVGKLVAQETHWYKFQPKSKGLRTRRAAGVSSSPSLSPEKGGKQWPRWCSQAERQADSPLCLLLVLPRLSLGWTRPAHRGGPPALFSPLTNVHLIQKHLQTHPQ